MKNILYISPFSHIGGGEISLLTIIKHLDKGIFNYSLICYAEGPFVEKVKELDVKIIIFKRDSLLSNFSIIWNIFQYIRRNNINMVHVNCLDIRAGIAVWLAGVPFIGHLRVIFPFTWRDYLFVRFSKKVIAVSNAVVNAFCKERPFYRDKFIIIPNAVEVPENIVPAPLKKEYNLPENVKLVGAVGRIDSCKGYEYFIKAANIIRNNKKKDVFFFIIGGISHGDIEGQEYLEMLKSEVNELKLNDRCFFTGFREDVLEVIKVLDVLVVPSVVIKKGGGVVTEGFGRVAVEAMALGVPVVASNIGGLKEIIENNVSGILVPPCNPAAIAEAVTSILSDEIKAGTTMGKNGKKRVEEAFTVQKNMGRIQELYIRIHNREDG